MTRKKYLMNHFACKKANATVVQFENYTVYTNYSVYTNFGPHIKC